MSISPELDEDNQLGLKMTVGGDSRDRAIELARRMEDSRRFAQTNITSERSTQSTNGDTEQFDIVAIYIPEPLAVLTPPTKAEEKTKKAEKPKTETPKTDLAKPKKNSPKRSTP